MSGQYFKKSINISSLLLVLPLLTLFGDWRVFFVYFILVFFLFIVDSITKKNFKMNVPFFIVWLGILLWDFFIMLKSPDSKEGMFYYAGTVILPFILFVLFNNLKFDESLLTKFFDLLFISGSILGIYSLFVFFESGFNLRLRIPSLWADYNMLSTYLMILLFFLLSFLINSKESGAKRLFYIINFVFVFLGILLAQTRAVWIVTLFSIIVFFFRKPKVIITISVIIGVLFIFFSYVFIDRFLSIKNFGNDLSSLGRLQAWLSSLILIKQNFLWGYGYDAYIHLRDQVFSFYFVPVLHSHNTYLRGILETGFIGFCLYFFFFFAAAYYSFKLVNNINNEEYKKFIIGCKLSLTALIIVFNFEPYFSLYSGSTFFIWLIIALVFRIKKLQN